MNNLLNLLNNGIDTPKLDLKGIEDPVPLLIDKLSREDIKIKIRTENDNTLFQNNKKLQSVIIQPNWNKPDIKIPTPQKILTIFSNKRSPNFPTREQKDLLSKLKFIPIYTVVNKNNEIITASPRECKNLYSFKWFQEKYNELFFWSHDQGSVSVNLFFINREDASSYLHEICKKEPRESENLGLKIKSVGLDLFYKLNRTSSPKTQNRLVADLNEIDVVLKSEYSKYKCKMHPKQKYSKDWFQGNPVYTIKFQKNPAGKTLSEYFFQNSSEKKIIFFSKEDALKAWGIFLSKRPDLHVDNNPSLEIYNLESLLLDVENNSELSGNVIFVPPYSSYTKLESEKKQVQLTFHNRNSINDSVFKLKLSLKEIQRFYKGVLWLFTSDTLPSEENSW
jgi:hypothetical protein